MQTVVCRTLVQQATETLLLVAQRDSFRLRCHYLEAGLSLQRCFGGASGDSIRGELTSAKTTGISPILSRQRGLPSVLRLRLRNSAVTIAMNKAQRVTDLAEGVLSPLEIGY
jgi:hypothetical protein